MQGVQSSTSNLLGTLGLEQIKVEIQLETVFQVKFESCLELQLCRLTLPFSQVLLHILIVHSDEVVVDIILTKVLRLAHHLDEIHNVLLVPTLARGTLHTEPRSPVY